MEFAYSPKNEAERVTKNHFKFKPLTLIVRKFNPKDTSKSLIKSEISDYFNSPDKFFDMNSRVCLSKKINLKKIVPLENMHKEKSLLKESIKSTKNNSKFSTSLKEKHLSTANLNNRDNSLKRNFEVIDNEKLKSIFNSFQKKSNPINQNPLFNSLESIPKKKSKSNKKSKSKEKPMPMQISTNLNIQNRRLKRKKKFDRQTKNISKYLSRKLRKNESDLLFNGVHLYRFKKEILDEDEDKDNPKKITDQSCLFKWISSLRRPKNFFGKRESYINVSNESNPLWSIVVERYPITKEMSVKAGYNLNNRDFKDFKRKRNLSSFNSAKLRSVENLDKISVKGKKLFNVEYNREMSNNNSKILHKVFVDNGKVIMYKDVNDIFGNKTLFKNYNYHSFESSFANRSLDNLTSMNMGSLASNSLVH